MYTHTHAHMHLLYKVYLLNKYSFMSVCIYGKHVVRYISEL